ncbi:MAG TPA: GMP synthase (glutamine-hydrolyzing), partial [Saprospiraceae bacterium]|nr:GMP synthase (glutamine-hydrolyzing) [Saprospiraceae bacterium]
IPEGDQVWMSHGDTIIQIPEQFELLAGTNSIEVAAYKSKEAAFEAPVYCIQFHPEVTHSLSGKQLLQNFLYDIADCKG